MLICGPGRKRPGCEVRRDPEAGQYSCSCGGRRVKPRGTRKEIAFGVVPAYCRYELFLERYRSAADFIRKEHVDADGLVALDIGTGNGYMKRFCNFGDIEWHGVEVSERRLNTCRDVGYNMHRCDVATDPLPFDGGSFDVVIASHVLEHLTEPEFALRQMDRVLRPNGLLIVGVPIKPYPVSRLLQLFLNLMNRPASATRWTFDVSSFRKLLRRSLGEGYAFVDIRGFRIVSARGITGWENRLSFYRWSVKLGKEFHNRLYCFHLDFDVDSDFASPCFISLIFFASRTKTLLP